MKKMIETIRAGRREMEIFDGWEEIEAAGYGHAFSEGEWEIYTKRDDPNRPYHTEFAAYRRNCMVK